VRIAKVAYNAEPRPLPPAPLDDDDSFSMVADRSSRLVALGVRARGEYFLVELCERVNLGVCSRRALWLCGISQVHQLATLGVGDGLPKLLRTLCRARRLGASYC
jgi:hypothetical protein